MLPSLLSQSLHTLLSSRLTAPTPRCTTWLRFVHAVIQTLRMSVLCCSCAFFLLHKSYLLLSEYGSAVLLSGLWRPAMEAGSHSGICTFGAEISWQQCLVSFICLCSCIIIPCLCVVYDIAKHAGKKHSRFEEMLLWRNSLPGPPSQRQHKVFQAVQRFPQHVPLA
jgi:hypothetical protein